MSFQSFMSGSKVSASGSSLRAKRAKIASNDHAKATSAMNTNIQVRLTNWA